LKPISLYVILNAYPFSAFCPQNICFLKKKFMFLLWKQRS